jgi:hypothetical protein
VVNNHTLSVGVRTVDSLYKLKIFIQIAMLYLEDDDPVSAETFIKKASSLIAGSKDPELELQYKTSYARIMDAKRRWATTAEAGRSTTQRMRARCVSKVLADGSKHSCSVGALDSKPESFNLLLLLVCARLVQVH